MSFNQPTILNTRAQHQAAALSNAMRKVGGDAIELACMQIAAMDEQACLQQQISGLSHDDFIIFVSANAVYHAMPYWPPGISPTIIAQGSGTAAALTEFALKPDFVPAQHSSQGILDLAIMQQVINKKIMILCGTNPRTQLMQTLQARGAEASYVFCYQRKQPALTQADFTNLDREAIDIVVTSSLHVLSNLQAFIVDFTQTWLYDKPLLVVSQDMLTYARDIPWRARIMQSAPAVEAIVKRINQDDLSS